MSEYILRITLGGIVIGLCLFVLGLSLNDWQFWALGVPLAFLNTLVML